MGSCSSVSRPIHPSPETPKRPRSRDSPYTQPAEEVNFSFAAAGFFETGFNAMEEMVFNSATGRLEIVRKEDTRPGRHVFLDVNKPESGGFFGGQFSPILLYVWDETRRFKYQKYY